MSGESEIIGSNATTLQVFYASVMLLSFLVCWGLQAFAAQRLQDRFGIPTMLLVLPVATVLSGVILAIGIGTNSLVLLGIGLGLWFIPRWSVDENARRAALALVPDERRTRVSFVLDLFPISIGLILSGPIAAVGIFLGWLWVVPALAGLIAVCAIPLLLNVRRGWEDSLLNWRLRRRKQNRSSALGVDTSSDSSPSRRITMDSLLEELND
jgi:MFS family permease